MRAIVYLLAAFAVVLPLVFRHRSWVRVLGIVLLLLLSTLHLGHLLTLHRLVTIRGVEQFHPPAGEMLPQSFRDATTIVQSLSQAEIPFATAIFVGLALLAAPLGTPSSARNDETRNA